jgi:hypothetical protein
MLRPSATGEKLVYVNGKRPFPNNPQTAHHPVPKQQKKYSHKHTTQLATSPAINYWLPFSPQTTNPYLIIHYQAKQDYCYKQKSRQPNALVILLNRLSI